MLAISLISKIQTRFQPSPLDNWISNGKVLNPGYEKPLLKPSFQEFYGRHHALVDEFAINCLQTFFFQYDHEISEFVVGFSY